MEMVPFRGDPELRKKDLKRSLEEAHMMILDTKAEMAQVKHDALTDPQRARELVHLQHRLDSLTWAEEKIKEELEGMVD